MHIAYRLGTLLSFNKETVVSSIICGLLPKLAPVSELKIQIIHS